MKIRKYLIAFKMGITEVCRRANTPSEVWNTIKDLKERYNGYNFKIYKFIGKVSDSDCALDKFIFINKLKD